MSPRRAAEEGGKPISLRDVAVDVKTRLGALTPVTQVGLPTLDNLMAGGLRRGDLVAITGPTGIGKTALALFLGYIAARDKAAVVVVSATLTDDEAVARLAARALHRERPEATTTYGQIWSGQAWQNQTERKWVTSAVDTVVSKAGPLLHVRQVRPFEPTDRIASYAAHLWKKHDRVVVVVDGLESFSSTSAEESGADVAAHAMRVAYELRQLAKDGCAIITTVQKADAERVAPATTITAELRPGAENVVAPVEKHLLALGTKNLDLVVLKNHIGPTGVIPLRFIAGSATFEERAP